MVGWKRKRYLELSWQFYSWVDPSIAGLTVLQLGWPLYSWVDPSIAVLIRGGEASFLCHLTLFTILPRFKLNAWKLAKFGPIIWIISECDCTTNGEIADIGSLIGEIESILGGAGCYITVAAPKVLLLIKNLAWSMIIHFLCPNCLFLVQMF